MNNPGKLGALMPSLVLGAIAIVYAWTSFDYSAGSQAIPLSVAGLALLLVLLDALSLGEGALARNLRRVLSGTAQAPVPGLDGLAGVQHPVGKEVAAFAWIIAFTALVIVFGFYIAIPVYVFAYLRFYAGKRAVVSALTAAGLVGFLYAIFELLLGYAIFGGLIAGDFM